MSSGKIKPSAVILGAVIVVVIAGLFVTDVLPTFYTPENKQTMIPEVTADRLAPIASIAFAAEDSGPHVLKKGSEVVAQVCSACHGTGAAGSPKIGDKAAWGPRIAQGYETLIKHALGGYKGMPAKGGATNLDDIEVARAIAFMANQAGANFQEPADPKPAADAKAPAK